MNNASIEMLHILGPECWCKPTRDKDYPWVWVHNEYLSDRPDQEDDDATV